MVEVKTQVEISKAVSGELTGIAVELTGIAGGCYHAFSVRQTGISDRPDSVGHGFLRTVGWNAVRLAVTATLSRVVLLPGFYQAHIPGRDRKTECFHCESLLWRPFRIS